MTSGLKRKHGFLAAGSLTAAAVALAFVPFNMGGCGGGSVNGINIGALVSGGQKMGQALSLSEKDEDSIGQSVALQATNRYPLYQDQNLNRYVTLVARTVGASSTEPYLKWYVGILDTEDVNAFSGPHGYIFVTRGALKRVHDESELAGMLGHEIGHVCKKHGLQAVQQANFASGALEAAKGSDQHVAAFGGLVDKAVDSIILNGFNQAQEMEADSEGVKYVIAAGYDPNGFLRLLQRLKAEQGAGGKPFGTHPGLGDRVNKISDQIAKSGAGGTGATLADRFAANVHLP